MNKEIWRRVEGFPDYEVSSLGRLKSYKYKKPTILTPSKLNTGYTRYNLSKNGAISNKYIHQLVAEAFVPNPDNKPEVMFLDGDTSNTAPSNLRWSTRKEIRAHSKTNKVKNKKVPSKHRGPYVLTEGTKKYRVYEELERDINQRSKDVAEKVGCHWTYVNTIRRELIENGLLEPVETRKDEKDEFRKNPEAKLSDVAEKYNISYAYAYELRNTVIEELKELQKS